MVEWYNTCPTTRLVSIRMSAGDPRHKFISSTAFLLEPGSNHSKHKLLGPTPTTLNCGIHFRGDRGLKIKKSIGGSFCRVK